MTRIETTFAALKKKQETALIPFLTAGDPDITTTAKLIRTLAENGADLIELGVPFSDPMADGPTIQAASERALAAGTTVEKVLQLVAEVRTDCQVPLVLMGYYNPVFRYGVERFATAAAAAGVDGLLLVDLPPEEAGEISGVLKKAGIAMITLLAPTTPPERMQRLAAAAEGYLYYVSMTGVTGTQKITPDDIRAAVENIQGMTEVPVGVGFGITTAEDAKAVGEFADGVVVGSALVKIIADNAGSDQLLPRVATFITELKQGLLA
ncbi:tryptophan synthase, alpha chain [Malonomonas rubra DSM 5091]|uniref:Tryptophan synthase alpha chain n=1 Tax=Malonomonas rubra DSM 5091 TaxID=1122189 RepID=A0A1M6F1X4_MALRU|nr:tryptophan synthase subunit alpha [Malonomonas rubra]SHI91744.1 tryptophan synthase, alpha chain [Malonomonas rubra DSM 5091]